MQMARVFCIYTNPSCLDEVIGNRGIQLDIDPDDETNDTVILQVIRDLKDGLINTEDYLNRGYDWALKQNWHSRIKEFMNLLEY